jgi:hypothetical protein
MVRSIIFTYKLLASCIIISFTILKRLIESNQKGQIVMEKPVRYSNVLFFICAVFLLTGCSSWNSLNGTQKGAIIGGTGGAVLGNTTSGGRTSGTLIGGAAGAVGGGLIGRELDRRDRRRYR